ncbi:MAG: hypothetical protein QOI60_521, partial [Actinomycetota bacterium]|nr:hypothetical protein [Actinomycetota bacterium]
PVRFRPSARNLMVTDAFALVAFVVTGAASHHDAGFLAVLARNLVPIGVMWVVVALGIGTYRRRSWAALVLTWAIAVPLGLLGRSWIFGLERDNDLLAFLLVGTAFSLLYLLVARASLLAVSRRRARALPA